jgi:hypothetical protein
MARWVSFPENDALTVALELKFVIFPKMTL